MTSKNNILIKFKKDQTILEKLIKIGKIKIKKQKHDKEINKRKIDIKWNSKNLE